MRKRIFSFIFLVLFFTLQPVFSGWSFEFMRDRAQLNFGRDKKEPAKKEIISAREIADRMKMRYANAKVIDVQQTEDRYGNSAYKVILLTEDGRRIDILVDARNGAVIEERGANKI